MYCTVGSNKYIVYRLKYIHGTIRYVWSVLKGISYNEYSDTIACFFAGNHMIASPSASEVSWKDRSKNRLAPNEKRQNADHSNSWDVHPYEASSTMYIIMYYYYYGPVCDPAGTVC